MCSYCSNIGHMSNCWTKQSAKFRTKRHEGSIYSNRSKIRKYNEDVRAEYKPFMFNGSLSSMGNCMKKTLKSLMETLRKLNLLLWRNSHRVDQILPQVNLLYKALSAALLASLSVLSPDSPYRLTVKDSRPRQADFTYIISFCVGFSWMDWIIQSL